MTCATTTAWESSNKIEQMLDIFSSVKTCFSLFSIVTSNLLFFAISLKKIAWRKSNPSIFKDGDDVSLSIESIIIGMKFLFSMILKILSSSINDQQSKTRILRHWPSKCSSSFVARCLCFCICPLLGRKQSNNRDNMFNSIRTRFPCEVRDKSNSRHRLCQTNVSKDCIEISENSF